jgi:hypothetical protein
MALIVVNKDLMHWAIAYRTNSDRTTKKRLIAFFLLSVFLSW